MSGALGATYSPHCARIDPARLVRGLADVDERLGAKIFEQTAVTRILPGRHGRQAEVVTVAANVHADFVVRATEGFTPNLPRERRTVVPLYSLMIATEPLERDFWDEVGFAHYETFADDRHLIIYGQRTADDRIAFGGRGAPYHFGSSVESRFDTNQKVFHKLEVTLRELFPTMSGAITHAWGGPLAMPRDHAPYVQVDFDSGMASAGGYTGDGVVLSHVAATALADLITSPDTETAFTRLPFVQQRLSTLGVRAASLDRHQRGTRSGHLGRPRRGEARAGESRERAARSTLWLTQDIDRARRDDGDRGEGHDRLGREEYFHPQRQRHRVGRREARAVRERREEIVSERRPPVLGCLVGRLHLGELQVGQESCPPTPGGVDHHGRPPRTTTRRG